MHIVLSKIYLRCTCLLFPLVAFAWTVQQLGSSQSGFSLNVSVKENPALGLDEVWWSTCNCSVAFKSEGRTVACIRHSLPAIFGLFLEPGYQEKGRGRGAT